MIFNQNVHKISFINPILPLQWFHRTNAHLAQNCATPFTLVGSLDMPTRFSSGNKNTKQTSIRTESLVTRSR